MQEFVDSSREICQLEPYQSMQCAAANLIDKKNPNNVRVQSIGQAFRNSWKKKETETKTTRKSSSMVISLCYVSCNALD